MGSWDQNGSFSESWDRSSQAMKKMPDGTFLAEIKLDASHQGDWQYGFMIDGPGGDDQWAITEEENPKFRLSDDLKELSYSSTSIQKNGATKHGDDVSFQYWAPHAQSVDAVTWLNDQPQSIPLHRSHDGYWQGQIKDGWSHLEGRPYAYDVKASDGSQSLRADPYARQRMGPQRGVDDLYLHSATGQEVHKFHPDKVAFTRFEVQEYPKLQSVRLVLSNDQGEALTLAQLKARLGEAGGNLVGQFHGTGPSDHWLERIRPDGSIELLKQGQAFATILPSAEKLTGLSYRFEGYDSDSQLLGDLNGNGKLEPFEAKKLTFNDPFSNKLEGTHRSQRFGIIEQSRFDWQHDSVPREAADPHDQVVYQLHPGSFFGSAKNVDRTSFKDITERLDYFKDLGVNVLELMPVNSFEGSRDWGYIGSHNMAISENYGFTNDQGQWVQGDEALKMFVDAAHSKGLKVFNDVVYNHFGGDFNNVWNVGGPENPWFEWSNNPKEPGESTKQTPWGSLPAYNKGAVREYITNHALHQLDEFHFDGLRFDFTHPIHAQGEHGGGDDGWEMLQKINRTINLFHPNAFIAAEEFPNHPVIVKPADKGKTGGAGFDAMWNTEFQHRLVHDHGNPSVLQEAANGQKTRVDKLMNHLLHQPGFHGAETSVTVFSNHDEVGNADRTINVANLHRDPAQAGPWERGVTRTSMGVGLLSPGMPLFFQGDESLASNKFSWGTPSTWDTGWDWLKDPESPRYKHHSFSKELLRMRKSTDAFDADAKAHRVYTHELDSVMAFSREKNGEEYLVVASFGRNDLKAYPLPTDAVWDPVLSSDRTEFGGEGRFVPRSLEGERGTVDLAAGGLLVFKKRG
jgi:maltooligosyltrehalose trehalohydrolase